MSQASPHILQLANNKSPYKLAFFESDDEIDTIDSQTKCDDFDDLESIVENKLNLRSTDRFTNLNDQTSANAIDLNNNSFESPLKHTKRKRRQLPQIPTNKQQSRNLISNQTKKIIKHISSTLSLQIELNEHKKPVTLQLINTDCQNQFDCRTKPDDRSKQNETDHHRPLSEELNTNESIRQMHSPIKSKSDRIDGNYRGLHKFCARHDDEIDINIGDSIYVIKQEEDLWWKGINLVTNVTGFFPSLFVIDCNYNELFQTVNYFDLSQDTFDSGLNCEYSNDNQCSDSWMDTGKQGFQMQREQFYLEFLGSLEVALSKGDKVVEQCIRKVSQTHLRQMHHQTNTPFLCIFEVDSFGIRFRRWQANRQEPRILSTKCESTSSQSGTSDTTSKKKSNKIESNTQAEMTNDKQTAKNDQIEKYEESFEELKIHKIDDLEESNGFRCRIATDYDIIDLSNDQMNESKNNDCIRPIRSAARTECSPTNDTTKRANFESKPTSPSTTVSPRSPRSPSTPELIRKSSQLASLSSRLEDDYFFDLKNVTYCGVKENYFVFITKHPKLKQKYAAHVFIAQTSQVSKMIEESIGLSFQQYYLNYIELSHNLMD